MKYQILDFTKRMPVDEGQFGAYYRVSKRRGIKVLHTSFYSKTALLRGDEWKRARMELKALRECESKITPKGYRLVIVKFKDEGCGYRYNAGIEVR